MSTTGHTASASKLWELADAIVDAEYEVGQAKSKFLRATGWEHTCSNPAAYWLWRKEIDGHVYTLPAEMAVHMQQALLPPPDEDEAQTDDQHLGEKP